MDRKQLIKLLKHEVTLLRFIKKWEDRGVKIFGEEIELSNYNILDIVLDELGALPDKEEARDQFNDTYYFFWNMDKSPNDKDYKNLVAEFEKMVSRQRPKKKKRIVLWR